jgi:hypothetical protein
MLLITLRKTLATQRLRGECKSQFTTEPQRTERFRREEKNNTLNE